MTSNNNNERENLRRFRSRRRSALRRGTSEAEFNAREGLKDAGEAFIRAFRESVEEEEQEAFRNARRRAAENFFRTIGISPAGLLRTPEFAVLTNVDPRNPAFTSFVRKYKNLQRRGVGGEMAMERLRERIREVGRRTGINEPNALDLVREHYNKEQKEGKRKRARTRKPLTRAQKDRKNELARERRARKRREAA